MSYSLKKALVLYLALAALVASMLACGSAVPATVDAVPPSNALELAATQAAPPAASSPERPAGSDQNNPAARTEIVVAPEWEFYIVEVLRGEQAMAKLKEASPFNKAPSDPSMEYVLVRAHAKYTGTRDTARIDRGFFRSMGSADTMYDTVSVVDATPPEPFLHGNLPPGGEVEGWVPILVAKDETGIMLVIWPRNNGMITGKENIRYISLEP